MRAVPLRVALKVNVPVPVPSTTFRSEKVKVPPERVGVVPEATGVPEVVVARVNAVETE